MSTLPRSNADRVFAQFLAGLDRLGDETMTLFEVLLNPRRIIAEVEQMRALQVQAERIEATDPALAAQLRARAARIGLR